MNNLLKRVKKLEKSLSPPALWDGVVTMTDIKIAAKRLGLRDYKFNGEVDESGICQSFMMCTDDMSILHEVLTMKKAPWGDINLEVSFFDGGDDEEEEEQEDFDETTDL